MSAIARTWWLTAAIGAGIGGAYLAGVVTGVVGTRSQAPAQADRPGASSSVLDEAAAKIAESAARPVSSDDIARAAIEGMIRSTQDRWGRYLTPAERSAVDSGLDGRYSGIGVWLASEAGQPVITSVQVGSPAERAGLRVHDRVEGIDGASVQGRSLIEIAQQLRGRSGTSVLLTVARGSEIIATVVDRTESFAGSVSTEQGGGGVRIIKVSSFGQGVGRQVRDALAAADSELAGIVLDLRGNGGGLLTEAVEVASTFLDGGPVVSYETRAEGTRVLDAVGGAGDTATPLVVLVDGGTASAAEVVAAALQDRNRAVVVGAQTYGKGTVQEPIVLSDGSTLEITVGVYRTPSGRVIDGVGIQPDLVVTETGEAAERRAIDVLRGLVASTGDRG